MGALPIGPDVIVDAGGEDDTPVMGEGGEVIRIEHGDGSVTVSVDGRPVQQATTNPEGWFDNLADQIDAMEIARIADEVIRGVEDDIESRKGWIEARAKGLRMLGLSIDLPGTQGASEGAPVEGMSTVRHPLLLEACLRAQANARGELLPADGPVKVRDDALASGSDGDALADALEKDMNHYLTAVATEYYPDTDRMLFMTAFGGDGFKKLYRCPLRMRPVSESVDAEDLIVNASATDLANAQRITHRVRLSPATIKRLQILGVYRDVPLSDPMPATLDSAQREKLAQQGVTPTTNRAEERDRELYETRCELDIAGYQHMWKGAPSGLPLPWRITVDVTSREVLEVVRNYDETDELPKARKAFVKYPYVPAYGFYDLGLVHILGDVTNAVTAAVREMLDNGMYANFPGFLFAKGATRQNTSIIRVPPGGGQGIETGNLKLGDAVMPLPYNTQQMPPLMALVQYLAETGARVGGTAEVNIGEGKQDAPVGTTLALIEQATKVESAVHKRLHSAQAEEFKLLVDLFREDPESFWRNGCATETQWTEELLLKALNDNDLVPQADPNTASHLQRLMKAMGLKQLQAGSPSLYDPIAVDKYVLRTAGISNPEQFFVPASAMSQPPPELQAMQAGLANAKQVADAQTAKANAEKAKADAKVAETKAKIASGGFGKLGQDQKPQPQDTPVDVLEARAKFMDAQTNRAELALKRQESETEARDTTLDRQSREHVALLNLARDILTHPAEAQQGAPEVRPIERRAGIA